MKLVLKGVQCAEDAIKVSSASLCLALPASCACILCLHPVPASCACILCLHPVPAPCACVLCLHPVTAFLASEAVVNTQALRCQLGVFMCPPPSYKQAAEHGVDGLLLSNHGGRQLGEYLLVSIASDAGILMVLRLLCRYCRHCVHVC